MSHLDIVLIDPDDDAGVDAWHDVTLRASEHGREATAATFRLEELRALLQQESRSHRREAWSAVLDGRVVAAAFVELSLLDNLDAATLSLGTAPEARRQGHGSALLHRLEAHLGDVGRPLVTVEVHWPGDWGDSDSSAASGAGHQDVEFALRHGYELGLVEVQRELALPVAEERLDRLAAQAAPHHTAYSWRSWIGPVPDDLVQGWCELDASLMTEAPTGDLEREPATADVAAQREDEARIARQGRTKYSTVALDPAGEVAAYSDLAITVHEPGRAYQWGTLVRRADRGHRLGLAIKVANLRHLQAHQPDLARVSTWNAADNPHMVAVNDALGFVPVEHLGSFQKRRPVTSSLTRLKLSGGSALYVDNPR